jgi:hypothetical protein
MRALAFIPSYNDVVSGYAIALQLEGLPEVARVLIIDESDDPRCLRYLRGVRGGKLDVIHRERGGKWRAWRTALEAALPYDALLQIDSDVVIGDPGALLHALDGADVASAYQEILPPRGRAHFAGRIAEIYSAMHSDLRARGKFNMGGQAIALGRSAVAGLLEAGLFEEPVHADDHVVCLAAAALGLRCTSVDCGLGISLPGGLGEWMRYRSRHRGAIGWAEAYVTSKTGLGEAVARISRADYVHTLNAFVRAVLGSPGPLDPLILLFLGFSSVLPLEDRTRWRRLEGSKRPPGELRPRGGPEAMAPGPRSRTWLPRPGPVRPRAAPSCYPFISRPSLNGYA